MRPDQFLNFLIVGLSCAFCTAALADDIVTGSSNISVDVSRTDGRIAMDLLGSIWILPAKGGQATLVAGGQQQASRPRWSPDGRRILYQITTNQGSALWQLNVDDLKSERVSLPSSNDQYASWHPQGERVVYASVRNNTNFDIWETDLPTGLNWRLTDGAGDEFEPVWSANGRDLAYISKYQDQYALMVRRRGRPAIELLVSDEPLSSISWRPDGTLLTYLRGSGDTLTSEMIILSQPPLIREFAGGEDFFQSPVSWRDRSQHIYTADGAIKIRAFGDWRSRPLPFRAIVASPEKRAPRTIVARNLALIDPPADKLVIRGARLFDGIWSSYRHKMDVLIESGKIISVEAQRDWPDVTILDLGNVTILPGFIDTWSRLPSGPQHMSGPKLLAYGVTTVVADRDDGSYDQALWEGEESPGPRLLPALNLSQDKNVEDADSIFLARLAATTADDSSELARRWQVHGVPVVAENWIAHEKAGADMLLGVESMPRFSLEERQHEDREADGLNVVSGEHITVISGLADASTSGIESLLQSRQAQELRQTATPERRHTVLPQLVASPATILLGSKTNGLPAGMALHAELRALNAAGLTGEQTLHTAGKNPAQALGLENQIGTITPGAFADMVLVSGDPLNNIEDALNIVAVVRNGRFFSLVRLLEQANSGQSVE